MPSCHGSVAHSQDCCHSISGPAQSQRKGVIQGAVRGRRVRDPQRVPEGGRTGNKQAFWRIHGAAAHRVALLTPEVSRSHLINTGARASARFNVGEPVDFWPLFGNGKLKRRERRAPFAIYEMLGNGRGDVDTVEDPGTRQNSPCSGQAENVRRYSPIRPASSNARRSKSVTPST